MNKSGETEPDLEQARAELASLMLEMATEISSYWLDDLEYVLWGRTPERSAPNDSAADRSWRRLEQLSQQVGGWFHWARNETGGITGDGIFVTFDEWQLMFERWRSASRREATAVGLEGGDGDAVSDKGYTILTETYLDMVRRHFGDVSEKDAEWLLWDATAFPMAPREYIEKQLAEAAEASGRNVALAVELAYKEMYAELEGLAGETAVTGQGES